MQKPQAQLNINPSDLQDIKCASQECESMYFTQVYQMKKLSALLSPDGQEQIITIPVWICKWCATEMPGQREV
jgi:hypothetical protein